MIQTLDFGSDIIYIKLHLKPIPYYLGKFLTDKKITKQYLSEPQVHYTVLSTGVFIPGDSDTEI